MNDFRAGHRPTHHPGAAFDERRPSRRVERIDFGGAPGAGSGAAENRGGAAVDSLLGWLLLDCWENFFACFRRDELQYEFPHFRQEATVVFDALASLEEGAVPDLATCQRMVFLLSRFEVERFETFSQRIDELKRDAKQLDRHLEASRLRRAVDEDQLEHCESVLEETVEHHADALDEIEDVEEVEEREDAAKAPVLAEVLANNFERERAILAEVGKRLSPEALAQLSPEAQSYLNFFRDETGSDG